MIPEETADAAIASRTTLRSRIRRGALTLGALALGLSLTLAERPIPSVGLPTFAQAYGVDCNACHTMVPALNAYGRYVQSTAFGTLDPVVMKRAVPIVVREAINYRSTGKLDARAPSDKFTEATLSVNLVGVLNSSISYRFEQTLYSNNLGGGNTGHFWVAYNRLFGGDGHLIVGKFDSPAPPAFSYWQDQSGFSSAGVGVGQHGYNLGGERWGVGFNYVPTDYRKMPFKAQIAYVGNSPPLFNASAFSGSNPYVAGAAGSDRAFQYKFAYARPDRPVEVGVYGDVGSYILSPGYVRPADGYHATGLYAQRDSVKNIPGLLVFYQQTSDANIGPGGAAQLLAQNASSHAFALEVDEPLFDGNVMLAVRPVEYLSGLQASKKGFDTATTAKPHYGTFDIVARYPKLSPYVYLTLETAVAGASNATYDQPAWRAGLKFAGPLFRLHPAAASPTAAAGSAAAVPGASAAAEPAASTVPSASAGAIPSASAAAGSTPPSNAPSSSDLAAGQTIYAANCAACHNAKGAGGIGPSLHGLSTRKTLAQSIGFIEKPSGAMPKLYPSPLSAAQVRQVAAYILATFK